MQTKVSPDEKITMNALENFDPFARPGQVVKPVNQPNIPKSNRDFSKYDEPVKNKPGRKPKAEPKIEIEPPVMTEKSSDISVETPHKTLTIEQPIVESRNSEGLPSYRCEFAGRDIMVGFPCYKTTNPVTAFAMIAMALDFGRDKIRFDMSIGDAMIYHSRNTLAKKFLETDAKWLLMLDDDIIPCIGRPAWMKATVHAARNLPDLPLQRHVIHRLIGSGKTLIGGAYFGRQEGAPIMCSDRSLAQKAREYADVIAPVDWVATGCMLVHRNVFNDIMEQNPDLAPVNPNDPNAAFDFFHPINSQTGEDVSFCMRAKKAGHQPHVDLGIPVFHVGFKTY